MLLSDLFLELGELVLEGLNDFLSGFLGLFELLVASDGLLAPVFVLFRHAVNVIGDEVD